MDINRIIAKEMKKYNKNGINAVICDVAPERKPDEASLNQLNRAIADNAMANSAMLQKSMMSASGRYLR